MSASSALILTTLIASSLINGGAEIFLRLDRGDFLSDFALEPRDGAEVGAVIVESSNRDEVVAAGDLGVLWLLCPLREELEDFLLEVDLGELGSMVREIISCECLHRLCGTV